MQVANHAAAVAAAVMGSAAAVHKYDFLEFLHVTIHQEYHLENVY
jgi:hypothetical protein